MALDEALLEAVASGAAPATLRTYGWHSRWLSIGMAQSVSDADTTALDATNTRLVRRPSGGTAVLHHDQVGWSLALPEDHPLAPPDIVESYRRHAEPVLAAIASLGVATRAVAPVEAREPLPDPVLRLACFGALAPHEIVAADGRKLVGWGQVRRRGVVLHHAVLSLRFDPAALAGLLATDQPRLASALARRVVGLAEAAGRPIGDGEVAEALTRAYPTVPGRATGEERARAAELERTKYAAAEWTMRR